MKLLIKKITLTLIVLLAIDLMAFCHSLINKDHLKGKSSPESQADTATLRDKKQADNDRFYYGLPFAGNLGIRFKSDGKTKSTVYEGLPTRERAALTRNIIIDGNCAIELADVDINENNAGEYRYRVTKNDGIELVSWAKPSVFISGGDKKNKYAYLGHFNSAAGQSLKVEIFHGYKNNATKTDVMQIYWDQIYPAFVTGAIEFTSKQPHIPAYGLASVALDAKKETAEKDAKTDSWKTTGVFERSSNYDFIETTAVNNIKFRQGDSLQNIAFRVESNSRVYFYNVSLKREVEGRADSLNLGETNTNFDIYKDLWNYPGKYSVIFTPKIAQIGGQIQLFRNLAKRVNFTVLPAINTTSAIPLKTVEYIVLIILTTGGFIFFQYRSRQKRMLAKEAQNRQIATLQLQSVRSQLNPHFIFNALAGIQNLMNKSEVEKANKYLARFARLTRNVLDDGQKELTSIEHEIDLLTDYLQMEQMRFGFSFNIIIDNSEIDQQIEIPIMLLQPFAENAVKHGVSALGDRGLIIIGIAKKESDLILTVQDNGKGFNGNQQAGMGMNLCEDRIKLLNTIYKNTTILLHKSSDNNGALITIELKYWV